MKNFFKAIYAGVCIGVGGYVYLLCENRLAGAFLFSLGLYAVLIFGLNLYTGKTCFLENWTHPLRLVLILLGNAVGAGLFGLFMSFNPTLTPIARAAVDAKIAKTIPEIMVSGIFCGICVAIAVKGYREAEENGKFLAVILGVMAFVVAGGEHIVADIFYVACACAKSRGISADEWKLLGLVLAFNSIGGLLFAFVDGWRQKLKFSIKK